MTSFFRFAFVLLLCFTLFCLSISPLVAQTNQLRTASSNFYPLNVGDYWEYLDQSYFMSQRVWDTVHTLVEKDTLLFGRMYKKLRSRSHVFSQPGISYKGIDFSGDVYLIDTTSGKESPEYRLSTTDKSIWFNGMFNVRFDSLVTIEIFGQSRRKLMISYFATYDTTYQRPLFFKSLVEGIGLISSGNEYSGWSLRGCRISGITYGTITSVEHTSSELPGSFALHQNYPNPFNPSTKISYTLPIDADVKLTVYDILGREVDILDEGLKPAGRYDIEWDSQDKNGQAVPGGVYFYRWQVGHTQLVRKMVIVR